MSLSGTLSTMSLPDLLQWLHGSQKSGVLEIRLGGHSKKIFFANGEISSSASNDPTEYLGQFLLAHDAITELDLQQAMEVQKQTGVLLGKILLMVGKLTEENLSRYLALKAEETIFSLFLWENAHFEFSEEEAPRGDLVPISLSINDVLLKGLGRYDELQEIQKLFGTSASVVGRTDTAPGPEFLSNPRRRVIWESIDGVRSIADIALESHMADFLACEAIHLLHRMGHVEVVRRVTAEDLERESGPAVGDPVAEGRRLMEEGKLEAAMDLVKQAVSNDVQAADLRELLQQVQQAFLEKAYRYYLPPEKVPHLLKPLESLTGESLTPQEMFLLSRINGTWDVRSVVTVAPFSEVEALRTLKTLREKQIIDLR
jgi:Domain of unknown function (DUF4388)